MTTWAFYPAFAGTFISVAGWAVLAWKKHDHRQPLPLSYLFVVNQKTLIFSRAILWVCASLFATTLYFFIAPNIQHSVYTIIAWTLALICEVAVGVFPAQGKTEHLHNVLAFTMGFAFMLLAVIFSLEFTGFYLIIETALTVVMLILGTLGIIYYRTRFLFYELPFIWLSHVTILIAALAVR